uniref:Uncharacterized protein n=1 Tax=Anguilla anguilla TaxID=7936 RepID=A0A0E9V0G1_ANGAN
MQNHLSIGHFYVLTLQYIKCLHNKWLGLDSYEAILLAN